MIPVKKISLEEAKKRGFTKGNQPRSGTGIGGCSSIIKVNKLTGEKIILEKQEFKDGKMHLIFMHKERTKYLKAKKSFTEYTKQFAKISGVEQ